MISCWVRPHDAWEEKQISSLLAKSRPLVDFSLLEDGIIFQFPKLNLFNIYIILLFKKYKHVRRIIAIFQFSIITILSHSSPHPLPVGFNGKNKWKLSLVRWLFFLWNISVPFSIHCSQWRPQSLSVPGKPIFICITGCSCTSRNLFNLGD